jgi:hypothetical protein
MPGSFSLRHIFAVSFSISSRTDLSGLSGNCAKIAGNVSANSIAISLASSDKVPKPVM